MFVVLSTFLMLGSGGPASASQQRPWSALFDRPGTHASVFVGYARTGNRIIDIDGFANWGNSGSILDYADAGLVVGALVGKKFDFGDVPLRLEVDATFGNLSANNGPARSRGSGRDGRIGVSRDHHGPCKNRDGEEEYQLYLINYIEICHNNWDLVKDVMSLGKRDKNNKRANTRWIKDLNDIRKITAHPEHGVLTTDQVALVNEYVDKVEQYFPEDISRSQAVV